MCPLHIHVQTPAPHVRYASPFQHIFSLTFDSFCPKKKKKKKTEKFMEIPKDWKDSHFMEILLFNLWDKFEEYYNYKARSGLVVWKNVKMRTTQR